MPRDRLHGVRHVGMLVSGRLRSADDTEDRNDGDCPASATGPSAEANVAACPCLILELHARNYVSGRD